MDGELTRIHDELRRAYEGDCWHGPPLLEILHGVNAQSTLEENSWSGPFHRGTG
jgi:hypothetical protein